MLGSCKRRNLPIRIWFVDSIVRSHLTYVKSAGFFRATTILAAIERVTTVVVDIVRVIRRQGQISFTRVAQPCDRRILSFSEEKEGINIGKEQSWEIHTYRLCFLYRNQEPLTLVKHSPEVCIHEGFAQLRNEKHPVHSINRSEALFLLLNLSLVSYRVLLALPTRHSILGCLTILWVLQHLEVPPFFLLPNLRSLKFRIKFELVHLKAVGVAGNGMSTHFSFTFSATHSAL